MFSPVKKIMRLPFRSFGYQILSKYSTRVTRKTACDHSPKILQSTFGQPTPQTHPHLMKEGEVVPGIQLEEFKSRRSKLMERILTNNLTGRNSSPSHVVIIPSASTVYISDKIPYVFRQNSDFLYFTGCQEPNSLLILTAKGDDISSTLFMRKKDPHSELWDGPRTGVEASVPLFGVEQSLPVEEFERFFVSFVNENKRSMIWYDSANVIQSELHRKLTHLIKIADNQMFTCPKPMIHQMRLIKSKAEIDLMQKSCDIASDAISKTISISRPGMSEHELFATMDYESRINGAEFLAYPPVVASGENACTIHYIKNNQIIKDGDMVLMDAGCEYHGYTSDITRTWPTNGTFSPQQRILYEIILEVQKEMILKMRERPSLDQVFQDMCSMLGKRLQEINLIPKHFGGEKVIAAAYNYCPHHVSHYLGMDVHDTGTVSRSVKVQPGMVVTVEPGIYVSPKNQFAPPEFHNLGIRIEDDVLIQEGEPLVLSRRCPKEIEHVEALAKKNQIS